MILVVLFNDDVAVKQRVSLRLAFLEGDAWLIESQNHRLSSGNSAAADNLDDSVRSVQGVVNVLFRQAAGASRHRNILNVVAANRVRLPLRDTRQRGRCALCRRLNLCILQPRQLQKQFLMRHALVKQERIGFVVGVRLFVVDVPRPLGGP